MSKPKVERAIFVFERYIKRGKTIYFEWQLPGDKEWQSKPTALKELPYNHSVWKQMMRKEYELKYLAPPKAKP